MERWENNLTAFRRYVTFFTDQKGFDNCRERFFTRLSTYSVSRKFI